MEESCSERQENELQAIQAIYMDDFQDLREKVTSLKFLANYFQISFGLFFSSCLDTRQPGNVFKKLDTRQSEILTNFLEMARLIPLRT